MDNIVFYARVSTDEQGQLNALENQIEMLTQFIEKNENWILSDAYIDEGKSGTTTKGRIGYNKLYDDLETDKFDIVVVKDLSRLQRNPLDYYKFIDRLVKNGKKLFIFTDNKFYQSDDALINGIKAILASEYSRDISKKVNAGHRQRQKSGDVITNGLMWGYDQKKGSKRVTINEEEAAIVKKVFNWYIEGKGFRSIYKLLEEEGVKNRNGNPFAVTTLKRMIKNEKYKGVLICNRLHKDFDTKKIVKTTNEEWIIHTDIIPVIISEDIWDRANTILSTKKRNNNVNATTTYGYFSGTHVYSGKIICGDCGKVYWHTIFTKKSLWQCSEYRSFGLKKEDKTHGCKNYKIYTEQLDSLVKKSIFKFINNKNKPIGELLKTIEDKMGEDGNDNKLKKLLIEKSKLNNRVGALIDMKADGEISREEYILKKQSYDEQLFKLETQLVELNKLLGDSMLKKEKLIIIQKLTMGTITNVEDITEKMIAEFLKEIIIIDDSTIKIVLTVGVSETVNLCATTSRSYGSFCVS